MIEVGSGFGMEASSGTLGVWVALVVLSRPTVPHSLYRGRLATGSIIRSLSDGHFVNSTRLRLDVIFVFLDHFVVGCQSRTEA
mgnify:CR=1 FL=1